MKTMQRTLVVLLGAVVLLAGVLMVSTGSVTAQQQGWRAEYYSNPNLQGNPVVVRTEPEINNYWGHSAPFTALPADGFSVRWTQTFNNVAPGNYRFVATMDDGMRIFLNGRQIMNAWYPSAVHTVSQDVAVPTGGRQTVTVEYFEDAGEATAVLNIYQLSSGGQGGYPGPGGSGGSTAAQAAPVAASAAARAVARPAAATAATSAAHFPTGKASISTMWSSVVRRSSCRTTGTSTSTGDPIRRSPV